MGTRITDLASLGAAPDAADVIVLVDTSTGQTKQATVANLLAAGPQPTAAPPQDVAGTSSVGAASEFARADHVHKGVPLARTITAGAGLTGGGDLSANRTLGVDYGASPAAIAAAAAAGASSQAARIDHVHAHGAQTDQAMHAVATRLSHGFLSSVDKDSFYEALNRLVLRSEFLTLAEAFNLASSGAGAATTLLQGAPTIVGHPGLLQSTTGTTATGRSGFWALTSASGSSWKFGGGQRHGYLFRVDQLSTGTDEFSIRVGMGDSISAEPTEGLYFVYDRTVSVNWQLKSARLSSRSTASGGSSVPVAVGWVFVEWVANAAGTSVEGFVNGVSIGTVTTNLPNSTNNCFLGMHQLIKSVGTNPVTVTWDACVFAYDFPTARNV